MTYSSTGTATVVIAAGDTTAASTNDCPTGYQPISCGYMVTGSGPLFVLDMYPNGALATGCDFRFYNADVAGSLSVDIWANCLEY